MKQIIGIIQPDRLDEVLKRLTAEEVHLPECIRIRTGERGGEAIG